MSRRTHFGMRANGRVKTAPLSPDALGNRRLTEEPVVGGVYAGGIKNEPTTRHVLRVEQISPGDTRIFYRTHMGWTAWTDYRSFCEWAVAKVGEQDIAGPPGVMQLRRPLCRTSHFRLTYGEYFCEREGWLCQAHTSTLGGRRHCPACKQPVTKRWTEGHIVDMTYPCTDTRGFIVQP